MDKRGVVTISTFSFIILILLSLFGLMYYFYSEYTEDLNILNTEKELLNSMQSFRSQILELILVDNSSLRYSNNLDRQDMILYVNNSNIYGETFYEDVLISKKISLYGIKFCSSYAFSSVNVNDFYFNGSCISLVE